MRTQNACKCKSGIKPIVVSRGTITYNLATLLEEIVSLLVGQSEYYIKNSQHLLGKLSCQTVIEHQSLVLHDVSNSEIQVVTPEPGECIK